MDRRRFLLALVASMAEGFRPRTTSKATQASIAAADSGRFGR